MVITISHAGYIKRTPDGSLPAPAARRQGRRPARRPRKRTGWSTCSSARPTTTSCSSPTEGKAHWLKVYELPQGGRATKGRPIVNMLQLSRARRSRADAAGAQVRRRPVPGVCTRQGPGLKQTRWRLYANPRKVGIKAINIDADDRLVGREADQRPERGHPRHATRGMAVRFHETDVRPMGRFTGGVRGITLEQGRPGDRHGDAAAGSYPADGLRERLRQALERRRLPPDNRGGKGVINIKTTERNGDVVAVKEVIDDDEMIMVTREGMSIRVPRVGHPHDLAQHAGREVHRPGEERQGGRRGPARGKRVGGRVRGWRRGRGRRDDRGVAFKAAGCLPGTFRAT